MHGWLFQSSLKKEKIELLWAIVNDKNNNNDINKYVL